LLTDSEQFTYKWSFVNHRSGAGHGMSAVRRPTS